MIPKLGLAGHKEDPLGRTLKIKDFIQPTFACPADCDLTFGMVADTDDLRNASIGLCALAGPGHFERWTDQLCDREPRVSGASVEREYRLMVPGFDPDLPETDTGLYALDVFKRWRSVGLFGLPPIRAFGQVAYNNPDEVVKASFLLGGVFFCFNLPYKVKAGSIFEADVWDVADDDGGIAGGHLVWNRNSWGMRKVPTPAFIERYCFDAFAAVSAEAIKKDGRAFSGLDLGGLDEALQLVTA